MKTAGAPVSWNGVAHIPVVNQKVLAFSPEEMFFALGSGLVTMTYWIGWLRVRESQDASGER